LAARKISSLDFAGDRSLPRREVEEERETGVCDPCQGGGGGGGNKPAVVLAVGQL